MARRFQGSLDSALTPQGIAQAKNAGRLISRFGADDWDWISSPLGRALRTAQIASEGKARIIADKRLREIEMGQLIGLDRAEAETRHSSIFDGKTTLAYYRNLPDGETIWQLGVRCSEFISDLKRPSVLVTHGITSRVLRCLLTGREADEFDVIDGEQGVVYHLCNGRQEILS